MFFELYTSMLADGFAIWHRDDCRITADSYRSQLSCIITPTQARTIRDIFLPAEYHRSLNHSCVYNRSSELQSLHGNIVMHYSDYSLVCHSER